MEENLIWVIFCTLLGCVLMLIFSAEKNTSKSKNTYIKKCKCDDWLFDGENGSKSGVFFKCKDCGKTKYIPYKELMGMPEEDYKFWTTRIPTEEERYREYYYQHKSISK